MPVQLSMSLFPLYFLPGPSDVQSNGPKGKSGKGLLLLLLPLLLLLLLLPLLLLLLLPPPFCSLAKVLFLLLRGEPFFPCLWLGGPFEGGGGGGGGGEGLIHFPSPFNRSIGGDGKKGR